MALTLTHLELERERVICNAIFLKYTDYHLNAASYMLMSEQKYLYDCMYLNALQILLNSYWYDSLGVFYIGMEEVEQADILRVIDFIHHYDKIQISVNAMNISGVGYGGVSTYLGLDKFLEFSANVNGMHSVAAGTGYEAVQAFLNGFLISVNDWDFTSGIFTYSGDVVLQVSDWFSVHFDKTS